MAGGFWVDPEQEDRLLQEARQRRGQFARTSAGIDEAMARRAVHLTRTSPNASPGLVQAAVENDLTDEQFAQLAQQDDGGASAEQGIVGRTLGAITDSIIGSAADKVWEQGIKPAIRGVFTFAESGAHAVQKPLTAGLAVAQGEAGSFRQAYLDQGTSPGARAASDFLTGGREAVDLGQGFFAGGRSQEESEASNTLEIDGQRANFGRAFTSATIGPGSLLSATTGLAADPGSKAYDVTAGVTQFAADVGLDPTAFGTAGLSKLAQARKVLPGAKAAGILRQADEAGEAVARATPRPVPADTSDTARQFREAAGALSSSRRNTVLAEKAQTFFRDKNLLGRLAEADAYDLYRSFRKSPANRIDRELLGRLGRATDEGEIGEILLGAVADGHITQRGFYSGPKSVRKFVRDRKFAGVSPRGAVHADDLDEAAKKVDSLLRQAKLPSENIVDEADEVVAFGRRHYFNQIADMADGDSEGLFRVVSDAMEDVARTMPGADADTSVRELTRIMGDDVNAFRRYGTDSLGDPIQTPFTRKRVVQQIDGEDVEFPMPTPMITSELADMAIQLPDAQDIRRAATRLGVMRKVYKSKGWDLTEGALSGVTRNLFRPLAVFRPAYIARIAPEEQARLAGFGFDSLFTHPFRFLQANVLNRKAVNDLVGDSLEDSAKAADVITKDATGVFSDPLKSRTHVWDDMVKTDSEEFITAWRRELGQLASAPEARKMAELRGNLDGWTDWARNTTDGQDAIRRLAGINDEAKTLLTDDRALRETGEAIAKRLDVKTGRDGELLDAVATARLSGVDFDSPLQNANLNKTLRRKFDVAPATVKVEKAAREGNKLKGAHDTAMRHLGDWIAGKPTSYLARFPMYRQNIVRTVEELMPNLTDDVLRREAFESAAKNLNLTRSEHKRLAQAAQDATGSQGIIDNINDLNDIAKTRSVDMVKETLFDITTRSAAQDAFIAIVPFLDAFKEVSKTWARMVKENPAFMVRMQAGYRSLEEGGVFHPNDFGDMVFTYPGGGAMSAFFQRMSETDGRRDIGRVGDIPILGNVAERAAGTGLAVAGTIGDTITGNTPDQTLELEGRAEGLNIVVQGVGPGFGPVVQWGAGAFIPDTPEYDRLREFIAPFGSDVEDPGDLISGGAITSSLLPAWMQKIRNAWTEGDPDPVQWNSTVGDAMKVLAESGRYDPGNPDDQRRLVEDAERTGSWILFIRGLTQATAPTGPSATWKLKTDIDRDAIPTDWDPELDPDGVFHTIGTLSNEYYRLAEHFDGDYELATAQFIQMFGREPYYITQAKSRSLGEHPVTEKGDQWMRRNEAFAQRYPVVAGYFAPPDEGGDLDYGVYRRQFEAGQRQTLTAEQQLQMANQSKARSIYNNVKQQMDDMGVRGGQRDEALRLTKTQLEDAFPGWESPVLGIEQTTNNETRISQLRAAVQDPAIQDEPLTDALSAYFRIRDTLETVVHARGYRTFEAQDVADVRERLEIAGQEISNRSPEFRAVWSKVLSRELGA